MKSSPAMEQALSKCADSGLILPRTESNIYLKVSYKGTGNPISEKWNVKIYTSGSVVTTDIKTLDDIVNGTLAPPDSTLKIIQIDDAGFGFPLCGIMIGVYDGSKIWTDTVDVKLFQGLAYERKTYLMDYTRRGLEIVNKLSICPKTHRIEICSGFINTKLKDALRALEFDVSITDIKGPLQDQLEDLYKEYVAKVTGKNLAYDIKMIKNSEIPIYYYRALEWGKKNAPHLLKSGWKSMQV
jgi:hypothetical protein